MKPPLWAPWRLSYILSDKPSGCIFCDFPQKGPDPETLVLHVEEHAFVILNRYPYINGHLMVVPRAHVGHLADLAPEVHAATTELLRVTAGILREAYGPEGMNIGMNLGRVGGAGIDEHVHYHILPRWNGDTNFMSVLGDTRVIGQGLAETWADLRPYFARLSS